MLGNGDALHSRRVRRVMPWVIDRIEETPARCFMRVFGPHCRRISLYTMPGGRHKVPQNGNVSSPDCSRCCGFRSGGAGGGGVRMASK